MIGLFVLLLVAADAASIYLFWSALRAGYTGLGAVGLVFLYLAGAVLVGVWVIRLGGLTAGMKALRAVQRGGSPTGELVNGLLAFVAGLLLIFPGLASDAVGLLLVFPPSRALARRALLGSRARRRSRNGGDGSLDVDYRIE